MVKAMEVWQEALESGNVGAVPCDAEDCIDCLAASSVIQTALDEARADERRAIVEWLRAEDAARPSDNYLGWIALRIERGEYIKEQEKQR